MASPNGRYRKLYPRIWRHKDFIDLPEADKLVALYCLTGPQTNRVGCFVFSPGTASEDLKMTPSAFIRRLAAICETFEWQFDAGSRVLFITSWWTWNPPDNANVLRGALKDVGELPETPLHESFSRVTTKVCETFGVTFPDASSEPIPERSPKRTPIQEQEQEQEQDQKNLSTVADAPADASPAEPPPQPHRKTPKRPPAPGADPRCRPFVEWFAREAESINRVPYVVEWARDMAIVKRLLLTFTDRQLRELAYGLLHTQDDWHDKMGRTIPTLQKRANYLAEHRAQALRVHGQREWTDAQLGLDPEPDPVELDTPAAAEAIA